MKNRAYEKVISASRRDRAGKGDEAEGEGGSGAAILIRWSWNAIIRR